MKRIQDYWEVFRRNHNLANISWLGFLHFVAAPLGIWWAIRHFDWRTMVLAAVLYTLSGFAITGGYHRFYSHGAYLCARVVQVYHLIFGAAAFQNSVVQWCFDHPLHHRETDTLLDPYNFKLGFWYAHSKWMILRKNQPFDPASPYIKDLMGNRLVRLQMRFYVPLAIFVGLVLPAAIAALWGDVIGGLLAAGFVRVMLQTQATSCVNSLAHWVGARPYTRKVSAVDNFVVAFITLGEGRHNFHHAFCTDYRSGRKWYHYDPTKWLIRVLASLRLARELVVTPLATIAKAQREARSVL